jgi:anti-sigma factor (TIGR02949 family)
MNCNDVRNAIYVYLDGEFAAPETADFEHHLAACPGCRELASHEACFIHEVKQSLAAPPAPVALRTAIEAQLCGVEPPRWARAKRARGLRPALALAVAASLAVAIAVPIAHFGEQGHTVIQQAVATHQRDLPMEVRGSADQIRQFLQANVPFAVQIPFQRVDGMELVGARLTEHNGRSAILFNYDAGGQRVSVLQLAEPEGGGIDDDPRVEERQGLKVVTFKQHGLTNSVVGDARAMPSMGRIVPAAFNRKF